MITIKREFIADIGQDQNAAGYPNGKTENIDKRIRFVLSHIPQSKLKVIFQHLLLPKYRT
jgi:hypothetical protein